MNRAYLTNPLRWNPEIEATRDRWNDRHCRSVVPSPEPQSPSRLIFIAAIITLVMIGIAAIGSVQS